MTSMTVQLRSLPGTEAAVGWSGGHTIVVDRPEGRAGGKGLGFNGGQLLAMAIGGCFCNDLRYVAHEMSIEIDMLEIDVTLTLEGAPLRATHALADIRVTTKDKSDDVGTLIARAKADSTVSNSLIAGFPVEVGVR